jgi:hypothetical protein
LENVKVLYLIRLLTEGFVLSTLTPFDVTKEGEIIE